MTNDKVFKIEKLKDITLENISGGATDTNRGKSISMGFIKAGAISAIPGLATSAAAIAYSIKSRKAQKRGDSEASKNYKDTAKTLGIISGELLALPLLTAGIGGFGLIQTH
ncbi:MAG: CD225/dispanin family protein [Clostridia bacterium]|nr:CD225/dispanin family protein [Clostridia bacterium]